jgi:hypothetical protein
MLGDLVAQVLELVLGQRADELPGLAPDRLVREGEPDAEGERVNVGARDSRAYLGALSTALTVANSVSTLNGLPRSGVSFMSIKPFGTWPGSPVT